MADAEKTGWRDFFTGKNAFLTAALFTLIFTRSIGAGPDTIGHDGLA